MDKKYVAHTVKDESGKIVKTQPLEEHLANTAEQTGEFAKPFNMEKEGRAAGALHDAGKSSPEFQNRALNDGPKCDHSTAGGVIADKLFHRPDIAMCIMGHHAGVPDSGGRWDKESEPTYYGRIKKKNLPDYSAWEELALQKYLEKLPPLNPEISPVDHYLRTRLLYSALVDADFLDTEKFCKPETVREAGATIEELAEELENDIIQKGWDEHTEGINGIRSEISKSAKEAANGGSGIYSLTVPTGSGKTLASLRFALNHARKRGLKHVIYVIPYINIIEQTADTFKEILGEKNVLEHHAEAAIKDEPEDEGNQSAEKERAYASLKLATENWDIPVVVTTAVQFFESLFSNRSSKSRKLHNAADAVIIYDEVQMLPVNNWLPLISIMEAIDKNTNATQLLCTATQPAVEFPNGTKITEIAKNPAEYQDKLKRVTFKNSGVISKEEVVDKMCARNQSLCIVNTKKTAKELFELLPEDDGNYHLSTNMAPVHRRKVLNEVRERLEKGKKVRLVATSLVEAGVDLDFEYVMREAAGLDSILQAAGRCNRNGKRPIETSITEVFETGDRPHPGIEQQAQAAKVIMKKYENWQSSSAIEKYFKRWRNARGNENLDKYEILDMIEDKKHARIAQKFKMIDSPSHTIYVQYDDKAKKLAERLHNNEFTKEIFRQLSPYSIQVYDKQLKDLQEAGAIEKISYNDDIFLLCAYGDWYNEDTGLELVSGTAMFMP